MSGSRRPRTPLRREFAAVASGGALASLICGIVAVAGAWPAIAAHVGAL